MNNNKFIAQIKSLINACSPLKAFLYLYQNIRKQIIWRRTKLHQKIWEINIPEKLTDKNVRLLFVTEKLIQRRHSANSVDKIKYEQSNDRSNNVMFQPPRGILSGSNKSGTKYILQSIQEAPEKYIQFIKALCESYTNFVSSSLLLEKLCVKLLCAFKPQQTVMGCDIHKSLFMQFILKDKLIKVMPIIM